MPVILGETPALLSPIVQGPLKIAPRDVAYEIERFLYREARLLEEERYEEWLGTMTEDIHYWMPGVQARYRKDKAPRYSHTRMAHFDDDMLNLRRRITRSLHETAWGEDPPTRSLYMVSNIEVEPIDNTDEHVVRSVILNVRGRNETEESWLLARRKDVIRRIGEGHFRLTKREIYITQAVLLAKNLNIFL